MICNLFPAPTYLIYSPDVPPLLYYAHIPTVIIALLFGFYVFWNGKHLLLNRLLFSLSILVAFWTTANLIAWTNIHSELIMTGWSSFGTILGLISVLCIYFVYVFLEKRDLSFKAKLGFLALLAPVILLAATNFNISGFDISVCDAFQFEWLPYKLYSGLFGLIAMIAIFVMLFRKYRTATPKFRGEIVMMGLGIEIFLFLFFGMEFLAAFLTKLGLLPDSGIEIYGMFGMVIFIIYLNILVVRFGVFHVKLFATQALVWGLMALTGAQFFYVKTLTNQILTAATFVLVMVFGYELIKSVRREIEAREKIERLATDLKVANEHLEELNKQKTEFVSFATHQLRSPLTAIKGNSSLILEGDLGPVPDPIRGVVQTIFTSIKTMISIVEDYLNISRIELGTMKYDMVNMDFKDLTKEVVEEQKPNIEAKNLKWSLTVDDSLSYPIKADPDKFKQVLMNTIDNSIKYTPNGSLSFALVKAVTTDGPNAGQPVIRFSVTDTGVGIRPDVMPKLFQKFSRAPNAHEANIHGTGLGLFLAKEIMTAHGGRVWAESAGEGKGSTFIIEMAEVK